ncbi:hypothetical protein KCP71_21080 [Salmonella enterica subsp. enterica]|nr:hypothetical protein KCP71_21080 [Salmonella enterica subsp. enterica]
MRGQRGTVGFCAAHLSIAIIVAVMRLREGAAVWATESCSVRLNRGQRGSVRTARCGLRFERIITGAASSSPTGFGREGARPVMQRGFHLRMVSDDQIGVEAGRAGRTGGKLFGIQQGGKILLIIF